MTVKICSRCKLEKPISDFSKKREGTNSFCKECNKIYLKTHYQNNKKYYKAKSVRYKKENKIVFAGIKKKLKCSKCNERDIACLDFHHINPKSKDISIASALTRGWSISKIMEEVEKCEVLCSNCHRKLHFYAT